MYKFLPRRCILKYNFNINKFIKVMIMSRNTHKYSQFQDIITG